MAKPPRRSRPIARAAGAAAPAVAGPRIARPADPRQAELFAVPFVQPMKPRLVERLPIGERWQYEIKEDGYRAQAHCAVGAVRILSSLGNDLADKLPAIARDLAALPVRDAVIDGEAILRREDGISDWHALHAVIRGRGAPDAVMVCFDLVHLAGEDWRQRPLVERQARLAELLVGAGAALELSEHTLEHGAELFAAACRMGLEGIVAKRRDSAYRSGVDDSWRKVKCTVRESFAVTGFDRRGRRDLAALHLSRLVDDVFVPCGSVGSGIGEEDGRALREAIEAGLPVVADVEHRGLSPDGRLRAPSFKGWHRP